MFWMGENKLAKYPGLSLIVERLRFGTSETFAPFDPRSVWIYAAVVLQIVTAFILFMVMGYSLHPSLVNKLPFGAAFLIVGGMLLRRYGHPKLGAGLEIIGLTYLSGVCTVLILFPLTELSWPFADWLLAGIDEALGFAWPTLAKPVVQNDWLHAIGRIIYESFNWQPMLVAVIAVGAGHTERAWAFVTASAVGAIVTMIIYPFVPAAGPCIHYGLSFEEFGALGEFPWQFGPELARLREQSGGVIRAESVFAMVSFPSYHAVAAVLFAWTVWPIKWARTPFLILNALMLAATVVIGIHYVSDVLGGVLVAGFAITLSRKLVR